jgi:hypothetical protein
MGGVTSGPSTREHQAQGPPAEGLDLRPFPVRQLPTGSVLFRAHRVDRGPWWFGSDGTGRFDLASPQGTCYLAEAAIVAVRERIGIVLGTRPRVPAAVLEGCVVSRLSVVEPVVLANLRAARATDFGVLNELASMVPYDVPQAWAAALAAAGHGGVRYPARFSTGRAGAVAIFGASGARGEWPVDKVPVAAADVPGAPVTRTAPRLDEITVVRTPRRRPGRGTRPR